VKLFGTDGLYIISIEKPFFNGEILAAAFVKAFTTTFLTRGIETILKALK